MANGRGAGQIGDYVGGVSQISRRSRGRRGRARRAGDAEIVVPARPQREVWIEWLQLTDEQERRACEQSLAAFVQAAWPVLEPQRALVWSWHMEFICGELEDVSAGRTRDLIINVPPGMMKSYLVSVFWPAWEWGPRGQPHRRYLCASHSQTLATRDNQRMRDLVASAWYQARWPHVQLRDDQNTITRYGTTAGGWRIGTSVGASSAMGEHPHCKIIDDAHDPEHVPSEAEREAVWHWFTQTMSTRGTGLAAATVIVGQRLAEDDLTGRVLALGDPGVVHVCLPMRYQPVLHLGGRDVPATRPTPTGRRDPRRQPGELLCPRLKDEATVRREAALLGPEGVAAQHQQQPTAPGGAMFRREWFRVVDATPADVIMWVRFWDVAGTAVGDGPRTAGVKMGLRAGGGFVVMGDIVVGRWHDAEVNAVIKQTAALDGRDVKIREEREPGSSGLAVVHARARELAGYDYAGVPATTDKVTRARPLRAQAEAGNVLVVARTPAEHQAVAGWLAEVCAFPRGALKDQVDATSGALAVLVDPAEQPTRRQLRTTW